MYILKVRSKDIWLIRENKLNGITSNKQKALRFTWKGAAHRFLNNEDCMRPFHKESFKINKL